MGRALDAGDTTSDAWATNLMSDGTTSSSGATTFSAAATFGTADASPSRTTGMRRVRIGPLAIHRHHQPGCPAILRPTQKEEDMDAESRRKIEMGRRALEFSRAHPDSEPGSESVVARLEQQLARANETATAQRDGLIHVRAASARKRELRRTMRDVPIAHLAEVGRAAAREEHELGKVFTFKPGAETFLAFRTAARGMATAAQAHRELLVKHGLSQSVLDELFRMLDQFDAAIALGDDGRTAHVGATRELVAAASEIVRTVRVMDGRNRQRFADQEQLLGSWISASTILGTRRTSTEPEGGTPAEGEVRPAA
jgi:hypothetical protein